MPCGQTARRWVQDVVSTRSHYNAGAHGKPEKTPKSWDISVDFRAQEALFAYVPKRIARQFWELRPTHSPVLKGHLEDGTDVHGSGLTKLPC